MRRDHGRRIQIPQVGMRLLSLVLCLFSVPTVEAQPPAAVADGFVSQLPAETQRALTRLEAEDWSRRDEATRLLIESYEQWVRLIPAQWKLAMPSR